jgi:hypothetical protein
MAISQGQITLDEAATIDKRLHTVTRTSETVTKHNEVFCLIDSDDGDDTSIARILAADPAAADEGLVVRPLQATHDRLNANVNLQVANTDVATANPVNVVPGDGTNDISGLFDLDSGAGFDRQLGVNLRLEANGGSVEAGTATDPLRTDPTGSTTQPVSGTVTADAGTGPWPVTDNAGSLTVDAPLATPVNVQIGDGVDTAAVTAAGDLQVTLASEVVDVTGTVTANAGTGDFLTIVGHTRNETFKEAAAAGGELDDTATTAATEDNISPVRITAQRAFHSNLRNNAGTEIATAANPLRTDPTGSTTQPVSGTVTADAGTGPWPVTDNASSLTVDAANDGTLNVQIGDGTETALVTATGDLQVTLAGETVGVSGTVTADQGAAQTAANGWPIRASDGANLIDVGDNANSAVRVNIVAGAGAGATHVDDAAFTYTTDDVAPLGAIYDTTPGTITDGNVGVARMNSARQLMVDIAAQSLANVTVDATDLDIRNLAPATDTVQIGDGTETALVTAAGSLAIDIAEATATVTVDSELPAAAALTDAFSNPTAPAVGAFLMGWDGSTDWERVQATAGDLMVSLGGESVTVTGTVTADAGTGPWPVTDNAGSLTVDAPVGTPVNVQLSDGTDTALIDGSGRLLVDINAATASVTVTATDLDIRNLDPSTDKVEVIGDVADDATGTAVNPVIVGGIARTADRTAVAATDAVYAAYDTLGKAVTSPYTQPDEMIWGDLIKSTTGYANLVAAPGAGVRNYITSISVSNSSATATLCTFRDSVTTANLVSFYVAASGGGASHVMPVPWRLAANAALEVDIGAALSSLYFSAQGYTANN